LLTCLRFSPSVSTYNDADTTTRLSRNAVTLDESIHDVWRNIATPNLYNGVVSLVVTESQDDTAASRRRSETQAKPH